MSMTLCASYLLSAALLGGGPPPPDRGKLVLVTYPVADLVVPVEQAAGPDEATPAGSAKDGVRWGQTLEERLMRLICTTIAPASWSENGGPGTLQYFPLGLALVVNQAPDVQEQIADLLAALRRLQDVEVAVEIRLLKVSQAFFERLGTDWAVDPNPAEAAPDAGVRKLAFLDGKQLLHLLESAQEDRLYTILQAPKLTVFSGQKATINVTDGQYRFVTGFKVVREGGQVVVVPKVETFDVGLRFLIQPAVSADRRSVLMNFRAELTELETANVPIVPVTTHLTRKVEGEGREHVVPVQQFVQQPSFRKLKVDKSFQVGDGKTAVLHWATRRVEGRNEFGPPVLSKIPYLNRRNGSYGQEAQHLVLLITPRVIINEEEEVISSGALPPVPQP